MDRNLLSRALFIGVIVAAFVVLGYPPKEKIKLGLDLLGGMHLVLQVETDDAVRAETDNTIDALERELADLDVTGFEIDRSGDSTFGLLGVPASRDEDVRDVVERFLIGWSMRRTGDRLDFELSGSEIKNIQQLAVNQARETIRNRIDAFGVAEPVIHEEGLGSNRIVVQLPGVDDPDRIKNLIKNTAFLEFRLVAEGTGGFNSRQAVIDHYGGTLPNDLEIIGQDLRDDNKRIVGQQFWALEKRRVVTGRDLKTARRSAGQFNEPTVAFSLTTEGGRKFGEVTGANVGRGLAIVLDQKVISAPTIQSRITTQGVITGSFTFEEVQDLVTVLRSGALPAGLTYLEERTVGPTLGQDSIDKGLSAGLIGGALVVLTMLLVYQLVGFNAIAALAVNIVLIFGALAIIPGAALTLPGIAGIVLTIGMAVDANVLVFERIREELRSGRTVKSAIAAGFSKALSSIIDANVTTVIAALFLYTFGTGPIRGFALTLLMGIVASFFTAIIVSRFLFDFFTSRRRRMDKLPIG